ncbi:MAG: hypothetical protein ABI193_11435 [Minicystis sp.]
MAAPSQIAMKEAFVFLSECMERESIEGVVDHCVAFSRKHGFDLSPGPAKLAAESVAWLRTDEEEPEFAPLTDIFEKMTHAALDQPNLTLEKFLVKLSTRYLRATEYLLPLLHHFSKAIVFLALDQKRSSISLFLRDAFFFWPPLAAHAPFGSLPPIHFVRYTRQDQRRDNNPRVVVQVAPGVFEAQGKPDFTNTLAADVGLYGTLVSALFAHQHFPRDIGVLFMVTRNPHLAGWLNFQQGAFLFSGKAVHFPDLVNVADTIESLFKPFCMPQRPETAAENPAVDVELSEIVTLCAASAFIWAVHRFSKREWVKKRTSVTDCLKDLLDAKTEAGSWYMHAPVTPWAGGPKFLGDWSHGFVSPMDNIWCSKF